VSTPPDPGRARPPLALAAGGIAAAAMLALGLASLGNAWQLQARLDQDYTIAATRRALSAPLSRGVADRQLRASVDALLHREDLGLRYLAVFDPEGVLLTHAGAFESASLAFLPNAASQGLRRLLYELTGVTGQARVLDGDGHFLGSIDYAVATPNLQAVHDDAVERLRLPAGAAWPSACRCSPASPWRCAAT
jgi:hypothetical protein